MLGDANNLNDFAKPSWSVKTSDWSLISTSEPGFRELTVLSGRRARALPDKVCRAHESAGWSSPKPVLTLLLIMTMTSFNI